MNDRRDKGQIVLILVLITVVGLTIGLSLVSRTITDIRMSSQIEQSSRAFSAAEAGIETALRSNVSIGPTGTVNLEGASANYSVETIGDDMDDIELPLTEVGSNQTIWLIGHNSDGSIAENGQSYPLDSTIEICFNNLDNAKPSILVTIFYKEGTEYKIAKKAFNTETRDNNLDMAESLGPFCDGKQNNRVIILPTSDTDNPNTWDFGINNAPLTKLLFLRLNPIYESTSFTIRPSSDLPLQGKIITSIGQTEANVIRKIQVFQGYSILPGLLDFSLFSEN